MNISYHFLLKWSLFTGLSFIFGIVTQLTFTKNLRQKNQGRPSWQPLDSPLWQVWQRGLGVQDDGDSKKIISKKSWSFLKKNNQSESRSVYIRYISLLYRCILIQNWVVVSKILYFHPYLGKGSNLTIIFFKWVETTNQRLILSIICIKKTCWKHQNIYILNPLTWRPIQATPRHDPREASPSLGNQW